jgi:hypothetical protein
MELINSFKKYLLAIVPNIVFKSVTEAEANETAESRLAGDQFVDASLNTGEFASIRDGTISIKVLNQVGIYDEYMIELINSDKFVISESLRDKVLNLHRKEIISNYVEQNDYYRRLYGLPNKDNPSIYLNSSELESFGYIKDSQEDYDNDRYENLTPLHELPQHILNLMESTGYLDTLYEEYSAKEDYDARYIKYLGKKKVKPLVARLAGQYELLYVPIVDNATRFTKDFRNYYEEARQYFLNQIYNYHFNSEYDFYEGYIGFFILTMAIQRTINSLFEVVIQRDFYDIETCRTFLEAYGVPFIQTFTFNQQLALVKNLNMLLMKKCTTNVLYDLLNILDYKRYNLTKYLLVKQHKTEQANVDAEPKPIFIYKTTINENGEAVYELDKTQMYDYYFIARDVSDNDTTLVESYDADAYSYEYLTETDTYWIEDTELVEKLYNDEINFTETKYASVNATIKMHSVLFEEIYIQKMICDKGSETSDIRVDLPLITNYSTSLLDMEVLLICLLCKYNNVQPSLLTSPSKELAVLGFNFDADLEAIKEDIYNNPTLYSQELADYIVNLRFITVSDVNEMFGNAKNLYNMLIEGMETTKSPQVYYAYKKLYNALLITDVHNEVFVLPDGSVPDTYMEWLDEYNHQLYEYVNEIGEDEIIDKINYITTKYISWFTNCKYLDFLNPMDDNAIMGIVKILRWFKSYTIDIKNFDVVYLFNSKYYNLMKFMDRMWMSVNEVIRELDIGYRDWIASISAQLSTSEKRHKFFDLINLTSHMTVKDLDKFLHDKVVDATANMTIRDKLESKYLDDIIDATCNIAVKSDKLHFRDSVRIIDPDDIDNSRLIYNVEYIKDEERLVLHNVPISASVTDETVKVDNNRSIDTESLTIG